MNRLIDRLTAKGIRVTEYENQGEQTRQKWSQCFLSMEQQGRPRPYLWEHLVGRTLAGKEADFALHRVAKWTCLVFFQHSNDMLELDLTQAKPLTRRDLIVETMDYADVYIVDPAYAWTYVIPHEADWGPFFLTKLETERGSLNDTATHTHYRRQSDARHRSGRRAKTCYVRS